MTMRIVFLDVSSQVRAKPLRAIFPEDFELVFASARGDDHLKSIIADADFAVSGQVAVSGEVLRAAGKLKLLHKWGVGTDNLDLATAKELGIKVARTTGSNAIPVAETAVGLMLSALRNISIGNTLLQQGDWAGVRQHTSYMLTGRTVGIIGLGNVGKALVRILNGFGCNILYNKPNKLAAEEEALLGVKFSSVEELLKESDVVSLHCPLTPATAGLIDRKALGLMKKTAILVNLARGGIVVEGDLIDALNDGIIRGAATDVYETEPLPTDSPLLKLPNLITTPHLAALAADNFEKSVLQMLGNFQRVRKGEPVDPRDAV